LEFHGYQASFIDSRVTSGKRLFYDRRKPFVNDIRYFNHYKVSQSVELPAGYLIPRQWRSVIDLMNLNRVESQIVDREMKLPAEVYRIQDVSSRETPYEGHHFHDAVKLAKVSGPVTALPGDIIIPIHQDQARYVVETLEPEAMDSLFRWNFFDTVLQRKEYFSPYVFEDSAEKMLAGDPALRSQFESRKQEDAQFADDPKAQLEFLYQRSKHNEPDHRRYPIARLLRLPPP
jgi:hypothetical protein